jgi:hypothetical protein
MIGYHFFLIVIYLLQIVIELSFRLEETPEQPASINVDTNFDLIIYNDQDKKLDRYV